MKPRLIVEQKITALVNRYVIYEAHEDGSKGQLLALAQQKRFAFKEKVQFYADEEKTTPVFSFRAEKVMDIHGKFFVEDADGKLLGAFRKDFKKSLINSTWHILDNKEDTTLTVGESNQTLAVLRRYIGFIPIVGEFADLAMVFFKYHFTFRDTSGSEVGRYQKTALIFDRYKLSMTDEAYDAQDWRILAAMAVALDALQAR